MGRLGGKKVNLVRWSQVVLSLTEESPELQGCCYWLSRTASGFLSLKWFSRWSFWFSWNVLLSLRGPAAQWLFQTSPQGKNKHCRVCMCSWDKKRFHEFQANCCNSPHLCVSISPFLEFSHLLFPACLLFLSHKHTFCLPPPTQPYFSLQSH